MGWSAPRHSSALFDRLNAFSGEGRSLYDAHRRAPVRAGEEAPGRSRSLAAVLAWLIEGRALEGSIPPPGWPPRYRSPEAVCPRLARLARDPYGLGRGDLPIEPLRASHWPLGHLRSPLEATDEKAGRLWAALFLLRWRWSRKAASAAANTLRFVLWVVLPFLLLAPLSVEVAGLAAGLGAWPWFLGLEWTANSLRVAETHRSVNRGIVAALYYIARDADAGRTSAHIPGADLFAAGDPPPSASPSVA